MKQLSYLFTLLACLLLGPQAFADTFTWTGANSDDWSDTGNWEVGGLPATAIPTATDDVIISVGGLFGGASIYGSETCHNLTLWADNSGETLYLYVAAGSTLTTTGTISVTSVRPGGPPTKSTATLFLEGNLISAGNISLTGLGNSSLDMSTSSPVLELQGTATITKTGTATITTDAIGAPAALVKLTGSGNQTLNVVAGLNYQNVWVEKGSNTNRVQLSGLSANSTVNFGGSINVAKGILNNGTYALASSGGATVFQIDNGAAVELTGTSGLPTSFGSVVLEPNSTASFLGTTQNIGTASFGALNLSGGTKTLIGDIETQGLLTISSGATLVGSAKTLTVRGDWTNNGTFQPNFSTVIFAGTSNQNLNGSTTNTSFYNLELNNTGAANDNALLLSATSGLTLAVQNSYTQTAGRFDAGQNHFYGTTAITELTMTGGELLLGYGGTGIIQPEFRGTTALSNSSITLNGSAAQEVRGLAYSSLSLLGSGAKVLNGDASVEETLTLNNSQATDLAAYTLTLGTDATKLGTLSRVGSAYLSNGNFRRWVGASILTGASNATLFPVGDGDGERPFYAQMTTAPGTGGTLTVSFVPGTSSGAAPSTAFADNGNDVLRVTGLHWNVIPGDGLTGGAYEVLAGTAMPAGYVTNVNHLRLVQATGAIGTASTNGGTNVFPNVARQVSSLADLTNDFYIATINPSSPLPVELVSFAVKASAKAAQLSWITASEKNSARFDIERSLDGRRFTKIGEVAAASQSASQRSYSFADTDVAGSSKLYYRLRQVDLDGSDAYSEVRTATFGTTTEAPVATLALYPTLTSSTATIDLTPLSAARTYQVQVLDLVGHVLSVKEVAGGMPVVLNAQDLAAGTYLVQVSGANFKQTQRLVRE
jgi:hypothetical protein